MLVHYTLIIPLLLMKKENTLHLYSIHRKLTVSDLVLFVVCHWLQCEHYKNLFRIFELVLLIVLIEVFGLIMSGLE